MSAANNDFISALYQIADDTGLEQDKVMGVVKKAILTAYKKVQKEEFQEDDDLSSYDVDIDSDTAEFIILADKKVVSLVTDPKTQILESQAKLIDPRLREGDHIQIDVTPDNFGRIAAQAAKQRILQGLRDAERDAIVERYEDKVGKIISGIIQRKDPNYVRVEIERAEAVLPNQEQIPGEYYKSAERKRFLLLRLSNTVTDKRMVLSRASTDFLKALFELEVPEIATGNVEIANIAREPGSRSKVAVRSKHDKVDAIGSCVGPRGTRIDSIMNEIVPEKVDIILWDENISTFIVNALSPAKVADIKLNKKESHAKVLVEEDALSLAIGKDGQNVRLAAKLTGYRIDITADKEEFNKKEEEAVVVEESTVETTETEEKPKKKSVKKKAEITSSETNTDISTLDLTDRQKKLLAENSLSSMDDLKKIASGEVVIEGFTKRDLEKVSKLIA
jgi:N utilization substance protein A